MITVHVGTDTYGRVKVVSGTPIVTEFAMLQFLPVYPLQSLYLVKLGPTKATGIPLLMSKAKTDDLLEHLRLQEHRDLPPDGRS